MNTRPLGVLSDFVLERLPAHLEDPSDLLEQMAAAVVESLDDGNIAEAMRPETIDLARLDAKVLIAGLVHSGLTPSAELIKLVGRLSDGELPVLLYQEIVLANPVNDLRTFTRGEAGKTECVFYRQHQIVEKHLASAVLKAMCAISLLSGANDTARVHDAAQRLADVENDLAGVIRETATLRNMNAAHFSVFRHFLNSFGELKGPSGAFTARIPILDLLLHGDVLPETFADHIRSNWMYFPRDGRRELEIAQEFAATGKTLSNLCCQLGDPQELRERVQIIGRFLTGFRRAHLHTVRQVMPGLATGEHAGTGGESNPGAFMTKRMEQTKLRGAE